MAEIMTVEEVAKYLKLKPQTVYKWAQEGLLPGAKLGKEWRFQRRTLDEWIDTSILLSKGGFNLMVLRSELTVGQKRISREEIESLLKGMDS